VPIFASNGKHEGVSNILSNNKYNNNNSSIKLFILYALTLQPEGQLTQTVPGHRTKYTAK